MKAEDLTLETLSVAIRTLRQSAGLTQTALAERSASLSPPLRRLLAGQVSDFERGRALPSFQTLLSMVVACSADGATVDFSRLQNAFGPVDGPPCQVLAELRSEMAGLRSDIAELSSIVVTAIGPRQRGLEPARGGAGAEDRERDLEVSTEQAHMGPSEVAAVVAGEVYLPAEEQRRLAVHLAGGCGACWAALEGMPAAVLASVTVGQDFEDIGRELAPPLLRALLRVRSPRSWPVLGSEHLEAVRGVRERTWGFARLLIEEADLLIDERDEIDESSETCGLERLLELPGKVVDSLIRSEPECRVGADLKARLELARAHGLSFERPEGIPAALERAGWYLRQGTGSRALWVDLLLAQARLAFFEGGGDPSGSLRRDLDRCLELLGPEEHLRKLEVTLAGVRYEELNAFWRTGDTCHLRYALVKSLRSWRELRPDPDPIRRLSGLLRLAELGLSVRLGAEMRFGWRPFGVPAFGAVAGTLEAHLSEFEEHAEELIVQKVRRVIAFLRGAMPEQPRCPDEDPSEIAPAIATSGGSLFLLPGRDSSGAKP
jgi:transcriptional regulator with XRE-family HTH domain